MNERLQWECQASVIPDAVEGKPPSADTVPREDRGNDFPFLYANCCLGLIPADHVDFHAFAKGQLMALAIFVPAAIALFIFFAS